MGVLVWEICVGQFAERNVFFLPPLSLFLAPLIITRLFEVAAH
jgi:hypothetical protein